MIFRLSLKNVLRDVLNKFVMPPSPYQLENSDKGFFGVIVLFMHHDSKGAIILSDRNIISNINVNDARYCATILALET